MAPGVFSLVLVPEPIPSLHLPQIRDILITKIFTSFYHFWGFTSIQTGRFLYANNLDHLLVGIKGQNSTHKPKIRLERGSQLFWNLDIYKTVFIDVGSTRG